MSERITIGEIFTRTNQSFSEHFGYILTLVGIFLACALSLVLIISLLPAKGLNAAFIGMMLLLLVVYAKLAVMIHRLVILDEKSLGHVFNWSMKELRFMGWLVAAFAIVATIMYLLIRFSIDPGSSHAGGSGMGMFVLLMFAVFIGIGVVFSRLALILPATAAEHDLSLNEARQLTSSHKFILFFLVCIVPYVTGKIFDRLPEGGILWTLVIEVISILVIIYEVGLLSHMYEALQEKDEEETYLSEFD